MTEDITKPKSQKQSDANNEPEQPKSVISKIGQWFTGKKTRETGKPQIVESDIKAAAPQEPAPENKKPSQSRQKPARGTNRQRYSVHGKKKNADNKNRDGSQQQRKSPAEPKPAAAPKGPARKKTPRSGPSAQKKAPQPETKFKLIINTDEPEECRLALLEKGKVEAFYIETVVHTQTRGNIYKGRVEAVEPNLQAAFVEIGTGKNGFLPFSDIHPEYYHGNVPENTHWKDLNITDVIKKGSEVLVQVLKEPTGNKGANLTTYISLPGRYVVLMPGSDSSGISKKIESEEQRSQLRKMIDSIQIPQGIGYIVRTASKDITKKALHQDIRYLLNLWKGIKSRGQKLKVGSLIYKEQDIISRFLRDHFTQEIKEIVVDNEEVLKQVEGFLSLLPANQKQTRVKLYNEPQPIFDYYQVEKQIEEIYKPKVNLPSGGSIVINPTEALVAIDVNSGRTSKDKSFEESIFLANLEAAEELARQLRLRDLGGLIVVDFIDMRDSKHTREVEKRVKACMKRDKAKIDTTRISKFGLMQISRQKIASPVQLGSYNVCEHCKGRGFVRSVETQALVYLRRIQTGIIRKNLKKIHCRLPVEAAQYLLNKKRHDLKDMEDQYGVIIEVVPDETIGPSEAKIEFIKNS